MRTIAALALAGIVAALGCSTDAPVETHSGTVTQCVTEDSGSTYPCVGEGVVFSDDQPFPRG